MSEESSKKFRGQGELHEGPDHASPYPVSRMAPAITLVDLAREIDQADTMVNAKVSAKLKVIADQIKALQAEAQAALQEAQQDQELHRAQCNFKRIPGKIYHLYRKADGTLYFSMLSPQDWRGEPPDAYQNSYRLGADLSWTAADELDTPDDTREIVRKLLDHKGL